MATRSAFPRHLIRSLLFLRSHIRREWTINGIQGVRDLAFDHSGLYGIRHRLARHVGSSLLRWWIDPAAPFALLLEGGRLSDAIALAWQRLGRIEQASASTVRRSQSAWTLLADMLVLSGQMEEAAAVYRRVLDVVPAAFPARWGLDNLRRRAAAPVPPSATASLPVHFFTIVLNGMPFIEHHIDELRKLTVPWHWHIVEGIAELMHDTKWSKSLGGRADPSLHRDGLSIDGTTEYLDQLAAAEPDRITIYRPPLGQHWQGKLAMVRAPLANIREECLLWEIDVDEFWTAAQVERMRQYFVADPARTAAFFLCHYFINNLVVTTANTYGNHIDYEWLRVWRFEPGDFWASHEPPRLCRRQGSDTAIDVAEINPFAHGETLSADLVFRHLAYVVPDQLRFKEIYYGYKDAVRQWESLPGSGPVRLRDHLAWINDDAIADNCEKYAIAAPTLMARAASEPAASTLFRSARTDIVLQDFRNILIVKLDNIGDAVLLSPFLRELRRNAPDAHITLMVRKQVTDIVKLCPYVDRVVGVAVEAWGDSFQSNDSKFAADYEQKSFDLAVVPRWDADEFGAGAIARRSGARRVIGFSEGVSQAKAHVNRSFDANYSDALLKVTVEHTVRQNLALLEFMNGTASSDALEAWIGPTDEARADALLAPAAGAQQLIAICPGATHPGKIFPPELLARILSGLPTSWRFVLLGSAAERALGDVILQALGERAFTLCGATSLREAMAVLRRCRAAIAMDSGLAHFAAAVQTPVAIFSMHPQHGGNDTLDQSPLRFGPWCADDRRLVIRPEHAWPGCETGCRWRNRGPHCIANIDLDVAAGSLRAFLARHVSSSL